jgi:hypothetical protein
MANGTKLYNRFVEVDCIKGDTFIPVEGVDVYIDGSYQGTSDNNGRLKVQAAEGTHKAELTKKGCDIVAEDELWISATLPEGYTLILEYCGC